MTYKNSLYINLYISSQTKLLIGETETEVIMESSFLKDGTVTAVSYTHLTLPTNSLV